MYGWMSPREPSKAIRIRLAMTLHGRWQNGKLWTRLEPNDSGKLKVAQPLGPILWLQDQQVFQRRWASAKLNRLKVLRKRFALGSLARPPAQRWRLWVPTHQLSVHPSTWDHSRAKRAHDHLWCIYISYIIYIYITLICDHLPGAWYIALCNPFGRTHCWRFCQNWHSGSKT